MVGYSINPPFISVEHDGSEHSALHNLYPSMENIIEQNSFSDTLEVINNSRRFAQEFMVVGINTNLHPRLDLKTKESSDAALISSDPQKVTEISNLILDEYDTEKLLSVPKYFPGYSIDYNPTDSTDNISSSWSEDFLTPTKTCLNNEPSEQSRFLMLPMQISILSGPELSLTQLFQVYYVILLGLKELFSLMIFKNPSSTRIMIWKPRFYNQLMQG